MALTNQPTVDIDLLGPERADVDIVGSAIEGGRNLLGEAASMELTGGGAVTMTYGGCKIVSKEQHEYINLLGARLNGGFRNMVVPIPTDWWGPFPIIDRLPSPYVAAIPHSDGSLFETGDDFREETVWGSVAQNEALNSGEIRIATTGLSRRLRHSDWFSIEHPNKGWRAYRFWRVISEPAAVNGTYRLAVTPPLREAVTAGTRVEFARPRFVARFPAGFTLPSVTEAFFVTRQDIRFIEAF